MKLNKVSDIQDLKFFFVAVCFFLIGCNKHIEQSNSIPFHTLSENQKTTNDFSFLFEHISDLQKENVLVGAEVLIIRNDTIQLHDAVGWSDRENKKEFKKIAFTGFGL